MDDGEKNRHRKHRSFQHDSRDQSIDEEFTSSTARFDVRVIIRIDDEWANAKRGIRFDRPAVSRPEETYE